VDDSEGSEEEEACEEILAIGRASGDARYEERLSR
jgi:hypothetical protein